MRAWRLASHCARRDLGGVRGSAVDEGWKWLGDVKIAFVVFAVLIAVASLAALGIRLLGF